MILEEETMASIGRNFDDANQKDKIICKCDYCGSIFHRNKHNIQRSWKHIKNDSCSAKNCVQKKRTETCRKLYGTDNFFQNEEIKKRIVDTCMKKYGVPNPTQNKEIKDKQIATCRKNYGSDNPFSSPEILEKIKKINIDRYGVANVMQNKNIKKKQHNTINDRYGFPHALQNDELRKKAMDTCISNHGRFPANGVYGKAQKDMQDWLNSIGFDFKSNRSIVSGFEIDLYDVNKKLAIEYCGLHWHHELSLESRNRQYHWNKFNECAKQNIQLLTIFSDEWLERGEQCRGHIKSILGLSKIKVFARNCTISQIDSKMGRQFFEEYHIQGKNNLGFLFYGLFHQNELYGVMSLGRHHRIPKCVVLDRLCFKHDVQVVGGASRLFAQCIKWAKANDHQRIISFSDNRWSMGRVYEAMNFTLEKEYKADYCYVEVNKAEKRISKQSQKKSAVNCPVELTEHTWAKQRGLARIWDCGKKRWVFEINYNINS